MCFYYAIRTERIDIYKFIRRNTILAPKVESRVCPITEFPSVKFEIKDHQILQLNKFLPNKLLRGRLLFQRYSS